MNGDEQYDPGYQPGNYPPPQNMMATEGSLKYQLDTNELIEEIKNILLGREKVIVDDEITYKKTDEDTSLMNERGISAIMIMLKGRLNKIFVLSDLEEEQIFQMTLCVGEDVKDGISLDLMGANVWGVRDLTAGSTIIHLVTDAVFATLRKSHLRGYQNFLKTTQRIHEISNIRGGAGDSFGAEAQPQKTMSKIPLIGRMFK